MAKIFRIVLAIGTIIFLSMVMINLVTAKDKVFGGRVIDADTKEPIEGAVVVASWNEEKWIPLGEWMVRPKDVKETLTNKNGEWSIKGPAGGENSLSYYLSLISVLYHTTEPQFIIFKPGYCSWPKGFGIDVCMDRLKPGGNGEIHKGKSVIELPELKKKEDRLKVLPGPVSGEGALEKQREFIRLLNEESGSLGLRMIYK